MKTRLFIVLALACAACSSAQDVDNKVFKGARIPEFTIVADDGSQMASSVFDGKVRLIVFFATWCPPCQAELAEITRTLWPACKDSSDFALLVIGREHSDAQLTEYNVKKGFDFSLYPDQNRKIYDAFASKYIPRAYLVDKDGDVVFTTMGFDKGEFERLAKKTSVLLSK